MSQNWISSSFSYTSQSSSLQPSDTNKILEKENKLRFFMIDHVDHWLSNTHTKEMQKKKVFTLAIKVIKLFSYLMGAVFPLTLFYAPAWVSWGVFFPTLLIFQIVNYVMYGKIAGYRRKGQYVPFYKGFLSNRFDRLHPKGEWDLKIKDARCKSDNHTKNILAINHPGSAKKIEETIYACHLEVDPFVKKYAAASFADIEILDREWRSAQQSIAIAKAELHRDSKAGFYKYFAEALSYGYQHLEPDDFPIEEPREKLYVFIQHYYSFCREFNKLKTLKKIGGNLWDQFPFLNQEEIDQAWKSYLVLLEPLRSAMAPLIDLFEREKLWFLFTQPLQLVIKKENIASFEKELKREAPNLIKIIQKIEDSELTPLIPLLQEIQNSDGLSVQHILSRFGVDNTVMSKLESLKPNRDDYFLTLRDALEQDLLLSLLKLKEVSQRLGDDLNQWIHKHPSKKIAALQKSLTTIEEDHLFCNLQILQDWVDEFSKLKHKQIIILSKFRSIDRSFRSFLKKNPHLQYKTPASLLLYLKNLSQKLAASKVIFEKISRKSSQLHTSKEAVEELQKELESFRLNHLLPLKNLILRQGESSAFKHWLVSVHTKLPALPFAPLQASASSAFKLRSTEQYRLESILKEIDRKMLFENRIRTIGIEVPLRLLLVVDLLFWLYFSSRWPVWGVSIVNLLGVAASYYMIYRMQRLHRQKQKVKSHLFLRNDPEIGDVPGNCKALKEVKEAQKKYGLEGIHTTWAHALTHGDQHILQPKNIFEAKKLIKEMGKEVNSKSGDFLKNQLIFLCQQRRILLQKGKDTLESKPIISNLDQRIKELEVALGKKRSSSKKMRQPTKTSQYEAATRQLNAFEKAWDAKIEQVQNLLIKFHNFEEKLSRFMQLEELIESFDDKPIRASIVLMLLEEAKAGEQERTNAETIEAILGSLNLETFSKKEKKGLIQRLSKVSKDELDLYIAQKINPVVERYSRLVHEQKLLKEDSDYQSIEKLQEQVDRFKNQLKALGVDVEAEDPLRNLKTEYRKLYELLSQKINALSPKKTQSEHISAYSRLKAQLYEAHEKKIELSSDQVQLLYSELSTYEKQAVWWLLPIRFKKMVSGTYLVQFCLSLCKRQSEKDVEKEAGNIWDEFLKLDPSYQPDVFASLPKQVQKLCKNQFDKLTGEDLISAMIEAEKKLQIENWWETNKKELIARYRTLDPYFQTRINLFSPDFIKNKISEFSGEKFYLKYVQHEAEWVKNSLKIEKAHLVYWKNRYWEQCSSKISEIFKKVDPLYREDVCRRLKTEIVT